MRQIDSGVLDGARLEATPKRAAPSISGEVYRLAAPQGERGKSVHLTAIRDAAVVLAPGVCRTGRSVPKAQAKGCGDHLCRVGQKLRKHGLKETEASIANKFARGTFPATFFLACLAALELDGVALEEI